MIEPGERGVDLTKRLTEGRKVEQAIVTLMQHSSLEKAAAALGISDVTLWRWMQKEDFQNAYRKARLDAPAFAQSIARLQHASNAAVATLLKVMVDKDAPAASRVRARPICSIML